MWTGNKNACTVKFIDRTMVEMCKSNPQGTYELAEFARLLKGMGVNLIEVDAKVFRKLDKVPSEWLLFRIETDNDLDLCVEMKLQHCVLRVEKLPEKEQLVKLQRNNVRITLEAAADRVKQLEMLLKTLDRKIWKYIHSIRLTGLREYEYDTWKEQLEKIRKQEVELDLCPSNATHFACATAVEGILQGAKIITGSFSGFGHRRSFAPLEEVMVSMAVLGSTYKSYNLTILPELCEEFSKITGMEIAENKPVLGNTIFTYESGVHAHGIEKDPMTYEPFAPELVGQKRQMKIGKHSGKMAVEKKLTQMGINSSRHNLEVLLEMIRTESILKRRDLRDEEIVSLL